MYLMYTHGNKYATAARSIRRDGKVTKEYIHLGKVVDKDKGIFDNKEIGITGFDLDKGEFTRVDFRDVRYVPKEERLILDFGNTYFLSKFMESIGISKPILEIECGNMDTLMSMILYYITGDNAACNAAPWYDGNYARILYPKANMDGRRISEFYEYVGSEDNWRHFFSEYIPWATKNADSIKVAIDSTGIPNSSKMEITAVNNHNGKISNEIRVIFVVDKDTRMPIFMRYVPGNVNDSSTLIRTLRELEQQKVKCTYALLDAGYPTETGLKELYDSRIDFISRLQENRELYKNLKAEHYSSMECKENFVLFGNRRLYVKRVESTLAKNCEGFAYCVIDEDRKNSENGNKALKASKEGLTSEEAYESMEGTGFFVLISNMKLGNDDVVADYYLRQSIEQFIDIGKNYAGLLPNRVQTEDAFRGHLLVSFIASAIVQRLQNELKERGKVKKHGSEHRIGTKSPNLISALMHLRNQKCKVYDEVVLPSEPQSAANTVYSLMGYDIPYAIPISKETK